MFWSVIGIMEKLKTYNSRPDPLLSLILFWHKESYLTILTDQIIL